MNQDGLDAQIVEWILLIKGEGVGHAFHGNQYRSQVATVNYSRSVTHSNERKFHMREAERARDAGRGRLAAMHERAAEAHHRASNIAMDNYNTAKGVTRGGRSLEEGERRYQELAERAREATTAAKNRQDKENAPGLIDRVLDLVSKGDAQGHPFHGNQWTDAVSASVTATAPAVQTAREAASEPDRERAFRLHLAARDAHVAEASRPGADATAHEQAAQAHEAAAAALGSGKRESTVRVMSDAALRASERAGSGFASADSGVAVAPNARGRFGNGADYQRRDSYGTTVVAVGPRTDKWGGIRMRGEYNPGGLMSAAKSLSEMSATDGYKEWTASASRWFVTPPEKVQEDVANREFAIDKIRGLVKDGLLTPSFGKAAADAQERFKDALVSGKTDPTELKLLARKADRAVSVALGKRADGGANVNFSTMTTPNQLAEHVARVSQNLPDPMNSEKGWGHSEAAHAVSDLAETVKDFTRSPGAYLLGRGRAQAADRLASLKESVDRLNTIARNIDSLGQQFAGAGSAGWTYESDEEEAMRNTDSQMKALKAELEKVSTALANPRRP